MKGVISIIWEKAACIQTFQIKGIVVPRAKFSAPVLSILCALSAVLLGADYSNAGPHQVMTVEFPDLTDGARSVEVAPMRPLRRILAERRGTAVSSGRKIPVKVHAPDGDGPFPIIVLSHGAGGDWDTHYAQAHHLASHGYAVLCIEHVGSNRERMTQGLQLMKNLDAMIHDSAEVLARPRDVEFALDCAGEWNRSHRKLSGKLDLSRVGAMGHSFGAFTTMVVCGMRPALDWLTPTVEPGKGLGRDQRERRIRCGVALSPQGVGEPFFFAREFRVASGPAARGFRNFGQTAKWSSRRKPEGGILAVATRSTPLCLVKPGKTLGLHRLQWRRPPDHPLTHSRGRPAGHPCRYSPLLQCSPQGRHRCRIKFNASRAATVFTGCS